MNHDKPTSAELAAARKHDPNTCVAGCRDERHGDQAFTDDEVRIAHLENEVVRLRKLIDWERELAGAAVKNAWVDGLHGLKPEQAVEKARAVFMEAIAQRPAREKLASEALVELARIASGEVQLPAEQIASARAGYCGTEFYSTPDGWSFWVFNDCDEWDYLERVEAPDGRTIEYFDMPEALQSYQPPASTADAQWGLEP